MNIGLIAVSALMLTLLLMPLSIRLAKLTGSVDHPDSRKVHSNAMPRLGGLAIGLAFITVCFIILGGSREVLALLAGSLVIVLTGLVDDIWQIRAWHKFVGEIIAASLFTGISGAELHNLGDLIGTGPIITGSLAFPITVFAIVGVVNALNLSDGLDGLAGGLSAIACLFLGYFAFVGGDEVCLSIVVVLFSCLMGFLYYNAYPAKTFMGDAGSLLLGFVLACVAVLLTTKSTSHVQPISMALILALPIADTLLVMSRRLLHGESPFLPDKTHLHHRLLNIDFPHAAVVPVLYALMASFGVLSIILMHQQEWVQFGVGICLIVFFYGSVVCLSRYGFKWPSQIGEGELNRFEHKAYQRLTAISGRSIPVMTWLIPATLALPILSIESLTYGLSAFFLILGVSILMLFPWSADQDRSGFAHGLLYISVFCLMVVYALFASPWVSSYLVALSVLVLVWVCIKLVFKRHGRVFLTSSFEMLMIIISWLLPVFLCRSLSLSSQVENALYVACLESIPFLLAMKIVIRRQPRRNRMLVTSLVSVILLIGIRGLFIV